MTILAGAVVGITAFWLIGMAAAILFIPEKVARFLSGFAASARAHYTEQAVRLIAGSAMVFFAPGMRFPDLFAVFGWVIVATTVLLLLTPWQWHHRFAEWAIPPAIRHLRLYGFAAFALGAFILYAMLPQ